MLVPNTPWAIYVVDGIAQVPGSGGTLDCSPSEMKSKIYALTNTGPFSVNPPALAFLQCQ